MPELFSQRRQLRPPKRALRIRLEAIRGKTRLLARSDHRLGHTPVPRTQRVVRIRAASHLRHDLALIHAARAELIGRILLQTGAVQIRMHVRLVFVDHRDHRRKLRGLFWLIDHQRFHVPYLPDASCAGVRIDAVLVAKAVRVKHRQRIHAGHDEHDLTFPHLHRERVIAQTPLREGHRARRARALRTAVQRGDEAHLFIDALHRRIGDLQQIHRHILPAHPA